MICIEYSQVFTLFDRDEDGLINSKELSILIRSLERNPTDNEIQQLIINILDEGLFTNRRYPRSKNPIGSNQPTKSDRIPGCGPTFGSLVLES